MDGVEGHRTDIMKYVGDKLKVRDQEIEKEIFDKANGVFMWVVLVVIRLNEAYDDGHIEFMKTTLAEIPGDLEDLFEAILINSTPLQSETISILQWVLLSKYPLTPEQLFAIVVGPPRYPREIIERRIIASSRGLVEIRRGDENEVQFIHQSIADFLTRNGRLQKLDPTLGQEAIMASHARLWKYCLKYSQHINTKFIDLETFKSLVDQNVFLDYAASQIFFHAEMSLSFGDLSQSDYNRAYSGHTHSEVSNAPLTSILSWLRDQKHRFQSVPGSRNDRTCFFQRHDGTGAGLLYVLVCSGCTKLIQLIIREVDINVQGGQFGNALQAAAYRGRKEIMQLLIDRGANINAQGGHYSNALQAAVCFGREDIVRLLLDHGANINAQGGYYGNALQAAAYFSREDIVRLLLDHGADINAQGGHYGNALQAAVCFGREDIVRLLLDHGANINAQGSHYGNALQAAVCFGREDIVRLLLDHGANINAQGGQLGNALQAAVYFGREDIVRLLLDHGANINTQGGHYGNALQAAVWGDREDLMQLLLDRGADINAQGGLFGNALQAAAFNGEQRIVQLLLDQGADINVQGGKHGKALQAVIFNGNQGIVQLLLDRAAKTNE
jgi:ankyrin repeat protein